MLLKREKEEAKCRISGRRFQTAGNHSNGLTDASTKKRKAFRISKRMLLGLICEVYQKLLGF